MLVINPDECIDCGVCEPECPAEAIVSDTSMNEEKAYWLQINTEYSRIWPNIVNQKEPLPDADMYNPVKEYRGPNKREHFNKTPGSM